MILYGVIHHPRCQIHTASHQEVVSIVLNGPQILSPKLNNSNSVYIGNNSNNYFWPDCPKSCHFGDDDQNKESHIDLKSVI